MPHGNQSESECLLGGKIGKIGKIPGILRVYLEKPGYTRVIPALLHAFAPGTTHTAATLIRYTNQKSPHTTFAYHSKTNQNITKYQSHTGKYLEHWSQAVLVPSRRRRTRAPCGQSPLSHPHVLRGQNLVHNYARRGEARQGEARGEAYKERERVTC